MNQLIKEAECQKLDIPEISKIALELPPIGYLETSSNYAYLKISDAYIHQLFPFIQGKKTRKPNYFDKYSMGAHITVIYPQENRALHLEELNQEHHFKVIDAFSTVISQKRYYALKVEAPSLLEIRRKYLLPDKLNFKNHWIDFHITFAVGHY